VCGHVAMQGHLSVFLACDDLQPAPPRPRVVPLQRRLSVWQQPRGRSRARRRCHSIRPLVRHHVTRVSIYSSRPCGSRTGGGERPWHVALLARWRKEGLRRQDFRGRIGAGGFRMRGCRGSAAMHFPDVGGLLGCRRRQCVNAAAPSSDKAEEC
jgi:hypothetical protein